MTDKNIKIEFWGLDLFRKQIQEQARFFVKIATKAKEEWNMKDHITLSNNAVEHFRIEAKIDKFMEDLADDEMEKNLKLNDN